MSDQTRDRAAGAAEQTQGQAKEAWGDLTGDKQSQAKGLGDQAKGQAQQGAADAKDKLAGAKDKVTDAAKKATGDH